MGCFLGIDGGGTRTVAWLAGRDGGVLSRAETGPSNPVKVGLRAAQREVLEGFKACWRRAGLGSRRKEPAPRPELRAVCAGISGSDRKEVHEPLLAWMRRHIPARRHLLTSDAAIALAAGVRDELGIIVIAGTGSIALARNAQGRLLRAGGWGNTFDDAGSGYDLGRKAVRAALEAFDGRGAPTTLTRRICRHLRLGDITEIVSRQLPPREVAALFPLVIEAAGRRDQEARNLCEEAARDLAHLAAALLKRTGWTRRAIRVIAGGGVFTSSSVILDAFACHLHTFAPRARVELLARPPVEGALWLARGLDRKKP
jgi:N-acetylglucosamine kinase-like BadF-type ATPase